MPSLKEYRNRIASVKSTKKITSAMKMVAASKLRRAQLRAEASQPYAERMAAMLERLVSSMDPQELTHPLIAGTGKDHKHLLLVVTADRGLCGGFNSFIVRMARREIARLQEEGREVRLICFGRKGRDAMQREFPALVVQGSESAHASFESAADICGKILSMLARGEVDVCSVLYNRFKNVIMQEPVTQQLIPLERRSVAAGEEIASGSRALYGFEPSKDAILERLLPLNFSVQVYRAMLDNAAGEQAARMTAMDNATNNAGDMISALTLRYNRARQAYITKELIEIISGAEAV